MNRTRALIVGATLPAALAGAVLAMSPATGSEGVKPVVGAWNLTVDPRPNPAGDPPAFPSLIRFNRGGTLTESVSGVPGPAIGLLGANGAGSGLGAWATHGDEVTLVFERFLYKNGAFAGKQHVEASGTADDDSVTLAAVATFFNPAGTQVGVPVALDVTGARLAP
jgi:hypothetical protein